MYVINIYYNKKPKYLKKFFNIALWLKIYHIIQKKNKTILFEIVGRPFSLIERLKLRGIGSRQISN